MVNATSLENSAEDPTATTNEPMGQKPSNEDKTGGSTVQTAY